MVGFSCFQTHIHSHRSKKTVQPSAEATHRTFQDCSEDQALKVSSIPTSLNPLCLKLYEDNSSIISAEQVKSSSSVECCSKSEGMDSRFSPEANIEAHQMVRLKKSQSLGSGLDREGGVSCGIDTEDEIDQGFSYDDSHEKNYHGMFDVLDNSGLEEPFDSKDAGMNSLNQYQVTVTGEHFQVNSDMAHNQTIFSVGDLEQLEREGHEDFATLLSCEHANNSGHHTPTTQAMIAKSRSLPDLGVCRPHSGEGSSSPIYEGPDYRSSDDLDVLNAKRKEFLNQEGGSHAMANQERDNNISRSEKDKCGNSLGNGYDSCNFIGVVNDGTTVGMNRVDMIENLQGESSFHRWEKMPTKDFKIKRIEEWVSMIDLQERSAVEETNQLVHSTEKVKKGSIALGAMTSGKLDSKISLGMEAAKNYLSSLTATSTSAQLANFGLVVIPFLSAYVSLRVLNLSGNSIVRITAGALPRGLHMLNLSKNNISTIEGLRELTRLRVLDLSYNRIFRIGHGLASCSSLKELYLAGNKISEVEGLHRLLKLNVLDLRFNKISTAKCLGQLAANYSSLQAISLEGNPAQRNVGDEQLKKYLQGLLPHLVYFNRQPIKASSSKEIADRPVRSALTVHKFDSGMRSEHKHIRKGSHSVATHKPSSSNHGRTNQAMSSPKRSKSRNGHLPPSGTKGTTDHRHHYLDLGSKLQSLRSGLSMHRSRSEGNLGAS